MDRSFTYEERFDRIEAIVAAARIVSIFEM
jgi:hypothetical protein